MYETVDSLFTGICDSIREKDGTTEPISHQDIPTRIAAISGCGETFASPFYTYNGGGLKIENMVTSNFGINSCIYTMEAFRPLDENWEIQTKFKTPISWVHAAPAIFASMTYKGSVQCDFEEYNGRYTMWIGLSTDDGRYWTQEGYADYDFEQDKWYWVRCIFDGERYTAHISTDGNVFEEIISINYSGQFYQPESNNKFMFGGRQSSSGNVFDGSIDLKETYIKIGEEIWWGGNKKHEEV